MYVAIVAELVDPSNTTGVHFPDLNSSLSLNNSLFIPRSYIQQRSNETGKLFSAICSYLCELLYILGADAVPVVSINYKNLDVILP